jgi:hypothetical protein
VEITANVEPHFEFCLEMECAAADAYLRFVYDDFEQAKAVQRFLGERGLLESSPPFGRVLLAQGEPIAMVSGVPGLELKKLRMRAAFAMQKAGDLRPDDATLGRIQLAHHALFTPGDDELYSSKLGVSLAARRTGAGPLMMTFITVEGRSRGFARVIGEVDPANAPMMRVMCDKVGWQKVDQRSVEDPATGRALEYVHLASKAKAASSADARGKA